MHVFDLYRRALVVVLTIYGVVRLGQAAGRWSVRLGGPSRHSRLARTYLAAMLLSVRIRRFWAELLQIAVLLAILGAVIYAHTFVLDRL